MSTAPKLRSTNKIADSSETRPVLAPAGNKSKSVPNSRKLSSNPLRKVDGMTLGEEKMATPLLPRASASKVLRRQDVLLRSNISLNASYSSDCSVDSFRSRASTGRILNGGRPVNKNRRWQQTSSRPQRVVVPERIVLASPEMFQGKIRCPWVTPNTESCYVAFHDDEWGVPTHDDKKLFELLVLCSALAELTWPTILHKRHIFREVFMDFDLVAVSKLNENKIISQESIASLLLTEPRLRAIIENARLILKIIEQWGSFDRYCWSFVNNKPIINKFRYAHQVPVKNPKADALSKDLMRRGFRCVGPTVIYSFMQVSGITNDHLTCCYRFEECCTPPVTSMNEKEAPIHANPNMEEKKSSSLLTCTTNIASVVKQVDICIDVELERAVDVLALS